MSQDKCLYNLDLQSFLRIMRRFKNISSMTSHVSFLLHADVRSHLLRTIEVLKDKAECNNCKHHVQKAITFKDKS